MVPIPTTTEQASTSTEAISLAAPITNAELIPVVPNEHASIVEDTTVTATPAQGGYWIENATTVGPRQFHGVGLLGDHERW